MIQRPDPVKAAWEAGKTGAISSNGKIYFASDMQPETAEEAPVNGVEYGKSQTRAERRDYRTARSEQYAAMPRSSPEVSAVMATVGYNLLAATQQKEDARLARGRISRKIAHLVRKAVHAKSNGVRSNGAYDWSAGLHPTQEERRQAQELGSFYSREEINAFAEAQYQLRKDGIEASLLDVEAARERSDKRTFDVRELMHATQNYCCLK